MLGERFVSESNANSRTKLTSILVGITAYTQKGHIARATLEATCFQTKAILNAMEKDSGKALAELAVDGGMTNSDLCMQVCDPNQDVSFQVANIE
jgi:glycerol kinase